MFLKTKLLTWTSFSFFFLFPLFKPKLTGWIFFRCPIMVRFREFKLRDKVCLSVVENEDTKAALGTTFIVYPSLLRADIEKIPIIPRSDFALALTNRVADKAHDDIYLLHSTGHGDSRSVTSFPLLGRRIISSEVRGGPTLKILGSILLY